MIERLQCRLAYYLDIEYRLECCYMLVTYIGRLETFIQNVPSPTTIPVTGWPDQLTSPPAKAKISNRVPV